MTLLLILKKWLQASAELLLLLPLLTIFYAYTPMPISLTAWFSSLTLLSMLSIMFAFLIGSRSKWIYVIVSLLAASIQVSLLFDSIGMQLAAGLIAALVFFRGHLYWLKSWSHLFPLVAYWVAIFIYFICSLIFSRIVQLEPYFMLITVGGFFSLILALMMTNSINLHETNRSIKSLNRSIVRQNRWLVTITILLIIGVALFNTIKDLFISAALAVGRLIAFIILFFVNLFDSSEEIGPENIIPQQPFDMGDLPVKEPSLWSQIILGIVYGLAAIILLILCYLAIRKLIKWLVIAGRKLLAFLKSRGMFNIEQTGYIDEKSKTITLKDLGGQYLDQLKDWLAIRMHKEPKWEELKNNRERARYLYRHWLLRHIASGYQFKSSLTPHEIGEQLIKREAKASGSPADSQKELAANGLSKLYNEARYGQGSISDDQISLYRKNDMKR